MVKMMITLKKVKRGYGDHYLRRNVKEGLQELRNDVKNYQYNGYNVSLKGDKNSLTLITNDQDIIRHIKMTANNYAIPYIVHS
jgi:ribosomal protein L7Ae-like RNA K-turn-binding protein